jgi:predicted AlkP superfamily phosphohydrolase/phosphomutase/tetratricopeptide (TPR) repeat protein
MNPRKRLLLVGWDSADWKIIQPLVDAGQMPAVQRLLEQGTSGNLTTLEPQLSPMLWTSIATGKHAYHHGVPGFTEVNASGQVVPVSAATRRCKTLWEMLGESGLKSHVVSWFATQGERHPNGCVVSNLYNTFKHKEEDAPEHWPPPPPGTYWPEDLAEHLNTRRVSPWDIDPDEVLRLFVPDAAGIDQTKDKRLWSLAERLAEASSVHSAACWLMENRPDWDFTAIYYRAIDEICHQFMPYHPPQMKGAPDADFNLYKDVVNSAYRFHDLLLARLMQLAGPDTAIVLVSDHGFHSDHLRPTFTPRVPAGITVWHRAQGVFAAMGPGFKKDELIYGARLLDVTPTILTYFDLPVGQDMEGRVLREAFCETPAVNTIPTWETGRPARTDQSHPILTDADNKALLQQFVDLGYINEISDDPGQAAEETNRENTWNMARSCMDTGRHEQALPMLEDIYHRYPERLDYAQVLARCQLRLGLLSEAERTVAACLESFGDNTGAHMIRANIAIERKQPAVALEHLAIVAEQQPRSLPCLSLRIDALLKLHRWEDCQQTCRTTLEVDPYNALAHIGLARSALHLGQPETAVEHALSATGFQYGNPRGHFLLGAALVALKQWDAAVHALGIATQLAPHFYPAWHYLAAALRGQGAHEAAAGAVLKMKLLRTEQRRAARVRTDRLRVESAARVPALAAEGQRRLAERREREAAMKSDMPKDQEFVIVSGLPRSGTSLMMQMLRAGGMDLMTDGKREADVDNPEGYWEWEEIKNLPKRPLLIEQAHGKATKVVSALLPALPSKHKFKIIFMTRPVQEIVASQWKMLEHKGTHPGAGRGHLETAQQKHALGVLARLRKHPRITLLEVDYPALVREPQAWSERIAEFIGPELLPLRDAMPGVVKPQLHRQRGPTSAQG